MTKRERQQRFYNNMAELGFSFQEAEVLRRAERTLQRWGELECGDGNDDASWAIERDDATGKPYMVTYPHTGKSYRRPVADREKGALRRVAKLIESHPGLGFFHQGDPRGCALYVGKLADIPEGKVDQYYTRWLCCVV